MAKSYQTPINLNGLELLNARIQNLATAPSSPTAGTLYYDTALGYARIYSAGAWVNLTQQVAGYTDQQAQDAVGQLITNGTQAGLLVTYNNSTHALNFSIPAGALTTAMHADGSITNVKIASGVSADKIVDGSTNAYYTLAERTKLAGVSNDAVPGTASQRTLGTGAQQAAAGNDARLSDARTPLAGSVTNSSVATNAAISADKLADGTTNGVYTLTERTKLAGIATGATANSTDAQLRDRSTHTGTQSADTIVNGTANKVYTAAEQTKLAGIATGATNYTDTNARANRLDQFATPTAAVSFGSQLITNVATPVSSTDAANKAYVDASAQGLDFKASVLVATTGNITLSGEQTIDGVTTSASRVLVKNQTTANQNGIYVSGTGAWTRASDADNGTKLNAGSIVYVEQGNTNAGQQWVLTTTGTVTIGTTALTFTQFSGASALTAGNGLVASGNTFNVGSGTGIVVSADSIAIDTTVVPRKFAANLGDGTTTNFAINHNLGTRDLTVQVYTNGGSYDDVEVDIRRTDTNNVNIIFAVAPAASAYRVVVIG